MTSRFYLSKQIFASFITSDFNVFSSHWKLKIVQDDHNKVSKFPRTWCEIRFRDLHLEAKQAQTRSNRFLGSKPQSQQQKEFISEGFSFPFVRAVSRRKHPTKCQIASLSLSGATFHGGRKERPQSLLKVWFPSWSPPQSEKNKSNVASRRLRNKTKTKTPIWCGSRFIFNVICSSTLSLPSSSKHAICAVINWNQSISALEANRNFASEHAQMWFIKSSPFLNRLYWNNKLF